MFYVHWRSFPNGGSHSLFLCRFQQFYQLFFFLTFTTYNFSPFIHFSNNEKLYREQRELLSGSLNMQLCAPSLCRDPPQPRLPGSQKIYQGGVSRILSEIYLPMCYMYGPHRHHIFGVLTILSVVFTGDQHGLAKKIPTFLFVLSRISASDNSEGLGIAKRNTDNEQHSE